MSNADRNVAAAKHFQDTAIHWTERYLEHYELSPAFLIRRSAVAWQLHRVAPDGGRARAIDLGCGTGPYLPLLAVLAREAVGMDIAPAMLAEARHNLPQDVTNVALTQGSVLAAPFPDAHFDLGVCVGVLEYFDDPSAVLQEIRRILMPGGHVVCTVPNLLGLKRVTGLPRTISIMVPPRWKIALGAQVDRLRGREPDASRYYLGACFTAGQVRRLVSAAGLEVSTLMTSGYNQPQLLGFPAPGALASRWGRWAEARRETFPWRHLGDNLIFTVRRPAASG